jgi:hypothetical protein
MDEFDKYRTEMNERLLGSNHLGIKRFFALDTQVVQENLKNRFLKGGPNSLDSLQNLLKPKRQGEGSSKPSQAESPDQSPSSPLDELLKGVFDKSKQKKQK